MSRYVSAYLAPLAAWLEKEASCQVPGVGQGRGPGVQVHLGSRVVSVGRQGRCKAQFGREGRLFRVLVERQVR